MRRSTWLWLPLLFAASSDGSAADAAEPAPAAVRQALERALADPAAARTSRLGVECARDGQLPAIELFGRGFGIWDGRRQFALPESAFAELLRAARDGGFAELAARYGGATAPASGAPPAEAAALKVICRVRLEVGGLVKEVVQLEKGEQSAALRALADVVYARCEPLAQVGVEAASLEDGLEKVARGELAAETLALALHRKPELHAAPEAAGGFLLRIEGRGIDSQPYLGASGYGASRRLVLDDAELASLARALARHHPGRLPANLWASDYTDFELAVLDRRVAVQARRFSGMTATTHGDAQRDFDALLAPLVELAARVERDGAPLAEP